MTPRPFRLGAVAAAALLALAACTPDDTDDGGDDAAGAPSLNAIEQPASAIAETVSCTSADEPFAGHPDWPLGSGDQPEFLPIVVSSLVSVGPSRLLLTITDTDHRVMASPDLIPTVSFYALERDPGAAVDTVEAAYLDTQLGRGLYRAMTDFDCAGEWGMEVSVPLEDGSVASERMRFQVHPVGTTPAIGAPAPRSDSPTASTAAEVSLISTDPNPFPGAYERTVGEVVTAGQPSLVFFATPAFCQTGICGPTVNLVKSVAIDYADEIGYVNVEPYKLHMTENGLQPELDESARLQPVQAVRDYGIQVEPYLFVVDAEGNVFAKFEGVVGADELRAAIEDVLGRAT